ncbi:MAG: Glutamate--tRNA ligase [Candidatus Anoxychlamydiales bacterium]|nr:Glutamate--tRNA ligase [Candidatus Anoxychlamydiales bacterium]NGX36699.1 Glutamate--tRNA ligase [Candidatus Anoxychlamydiales bacterium]
MTQIRTRIAPSPTGDPHVGTIYISIFNLAFAKKYGGKFILRIEDTDQTRSRPIYEENIFKSIKWANVHWDEGPDIGGAYGPYRQSERLSIYKKYAEKLVENGKAYRCFATKDELDEMRQVAKKMGKRLGYDRRYRNLSEEEIAKRLKEKQSYVIRLKVPLTGECIFEDGIKGQIVTPLADVDDQVLMKSDGFPTYHFANVVDDHLMKITHVIRGDEWVSSTPKHILLYESFGWDKPVFMHMPLLLGKDGRKLSKRKNPTSTFYFKDSGYLPDALVNFLTLMGYSTKDEKEIYTFDDFLKNFDPTRIGTSGAFFDIQKLDWLNQQYIINTLSEKDLLAKLKAWQFNDDFFEKLLPLCHTRMKTLGDFIALFDFIFVKDINYTDELLTPKSLAKADSQIILYAMMLLLEKQDVLEASKIEKASHEVADLFKINHKKIVMPLLFATVMGKRFGPPLFKSCEILKKDRVRARFLNAIEFLGGISNKKISSIKDGLEKKDLTELLLKAKA